MKAESYSIGRVAGLLFGEEFEFGEGAGPVGAEEAGEAAVGEEFAAGLASRAVIRFVVGVADALDGMAAARAGLLVTAVDGHAFAEGGDVFREVAGGFGAEAIGPSSETVTDGFIEANDFGVGEFLGKSEWAKLSLPEDLVGIGVADAGEEARVGESAFEGVIVGRKAGGKLLEAGFEDFEASRIEGAEAGFAFDNVEGSAFFRAGFGPENGTVGEVEGGEAAWGRNLDAAGFRRDELPVEAAGDHEVKDEPQVVFEADADALAEAAELENLLAKCAGKRRSGGAQKKGTGDANGLESLAEDAGLEGFDINGDVGEFGHGVDESETQLRSYANYRTTR